MAIRCYLLANIRVYLIFILFMEYVNNGRNHSANVKTLNIQVRLIETHLDSLMKKPYPLGS